MKDTFQRFGSRLPLSVGPMVWIRARRVSRGRMRLERFPAGELGSADSSVSAGASPCACGDTVKVVVAAVAMGMKLDTCGLACTN